MTKTENALVACEKVLNGIEDNTITVTSALLLCLKIARLLNDTDAIMWLQYEYGGYPRNKNGYIQKEAWQIAWGKGRGYIEDGKELVFSEIASELEEKIAAQRSAVNNFTTQGASVSGEWAAVAMNKLTTTVSSSTGVLVRQIASSEKQLTILKSKYYDYALEKQIEISFGNVATTVFSEYRTRVENIHRPLQRAEGSLKELQKNYLRNIFLNTERKNIKPNREKKLTLVENTIKINFQQLLKS